MKKLTFCLALALSFFGARAQDFKFEVKEHDFGEVAHATSKIEHIFEFTNSGAQPLVITKVLTSCSCVKVEYPKKPVAPGAAGEVKVIYEVSKKDPGVFYKVVELYANTTPKRTNLIVKGTAVK